MLQPLEGVEATRIGECEVCKRIFWIGRAGMVCCSHACGNVLNNRRRRLKYAKNLTEYKMKKIDQEERRELKKKRQR